MKKSNIIWGLVFIIIGILIGIKSLGILDINIFFKGWWSLFIIIPCLIGLFTDNDKVGSIIGILVGIFLLLSAQEIISYDLLWKLALPIILVIIGISILFKTNRTENAPKLNKDGTNDYFTAFGGQNIEYGKKEFKGAEITSIFGGIKLNLKDAIIKEDVKIEASSIFGGIEITVPSSVNISVNSIPIFGGVTNNVKNKEEKKHTIYINSVALFGGVKIYDQEPKND